MSNEAWKVVLEGCLASAFYCSGAVTELFGMQRSGKIINISSCSYLGNAGQFNYSSAKAGMIGLTRALAKELGKFNVNVNATSPWLIETEGLKSLESYELLKLRGQKQTLLGCLGQPEEIAKVALFLASEDSAYITGEILHVLRGAWKIESSRRQVQ